MVQSVSFPLPLTIAQKLPVRNSWELINKELPIPIPILDYFELIREVLANTLYKLLQHELLGPHPKTPTSQKLFMFLPEKMQKAWPTYIFQLNVLSARPYFCTFLLFKPAIFLRGDLCFQSAQRFCKPKSSFLEPPPFLNWIRLVLNAVELKIRPRFGGFWVENPSKICFGLFSPVL